MKEYIRMISYMISIDQYMISIYLSLIALYQAVLFCSLISFLNRIYPNFTYSLLIHCFVSLLIHIIHIYQIHLKK